MNNQNTIEKMKQMRLGEMAEVHYTNTKNNINLELTLDQYVDLLVDREWENRQNNKNQKSDQDCPFSLSGYYPGYWLLCEQATGQKHLPTAGFARFYP